MQIVSSRNQKLHYSPLRYPGGKTVLSSFFGDVMQKFNLKNVTYVEPFAGGAGAALSLLFNGQVNKIVINDLDKAIYSFWMSAVFDSEKFITKINSTEVTIKEWKRQKAIYINPKSDQFSLGFATFFLNRTNVSGILNGGPIGNFKQDGKWKIDARFNKQGLIEKIRKIAVYKNSIAVFNEDGVKLIKRYLKKKNTFIYLDPPYYEKGAALYFNHYNADNHKMLAEELNKFPNSHWLLTYDDKPEIRFLYKNRKVINFSLNYNAYESRVGKEILITSDIFSTI